MIICDCICSIIFPYIPLESPEVAKEQALAPKKLAGLAGMQARLVHLARLVDGDGF